ncbi:MAG: response regulator [Planctomycetota bacterium]|jgi:DNA-binding NarL/FixJ family response regulator
MSDDKVATILIIDDEPMVCRTITAYLEDCNFRILCTRNGRDGLKIFYQELPDLVLVDLRMPDMDGLEVLSALHEFKPETPVVVISGTSTISDAVEALRRGACDFILKPIEDMSVLLHVVLKALERARMIRDNQIYREHLEKKLNKRAAELEQKNIALQELMDRIEEERSKLGANVSSSIEKMILPLMQTLKQGLPDKKKEIARQVEHSLEEIASPFMERLSKELARLTPTEIRICNLIRRRLLNKEIAEMLNLSIDTIKTHRRNIRRKLGVTNKKVNLASYLLTLMPEVRKKSRLETSPAPVQEQAASTNS